MKFSLAFALFAVFQFQYACGNPLVITTAKSMLAKVDSSSDSSSALDLDDFMECGGDCIDATFNANEALVINLTGCNAELFGAGVSLNCLIVCSESNPGISLTPQEQNFDDACVIRVLAFDAGFTGLTDTFDFSLVNPETTCTSEVTCADIFAVAGTAGLEFSPAQTAFVTAGALIVVGLLYTLVH